jgi:hypothetical protein
MEMMIADRTWIWCLTSGLVCAAVVAELQRRRRLNLFGEARLLGVRTGWAARLLPRILPAAAVAAAASIIPESGVTRHTGQERVQTLVFLLDTLWVEPAPGTSTLLAESIRVTAMQFPGVKISACRSGVEEALVPATWDFGGMLVVAERLSLDWQAGRDAGALQPDLDRIAASQGDEGTRAAIVILTTQSAEEVERRSLMPPAGTGLLCVSSAGPRTRFGLCSREGNWSWTDGPEKLPALLESDTRGTGPAAWMRSLDSVQLLAAGSLLLLALDFIWVLLLQGRRSVAG